MDFSRALREQTELHSATDRAALSVARIMKTANSATMATLATNQLTASHFSPTYQIISGPTVNADKTEVCLTSQTILPTTIMKIANVHSVTIKAHSCAKVGGTTYEVALALDNTGSMSGNKLSDMKTAAKNLVDQLLPANEPLHYASISLVPFNYSVKAFNPATIATSGDTDETTRFSHLNWIDQNGGSSIHWENFPKLPNGSFQPVNRFELFKNINQTWAGCFETRPGVHALGDQPASIATPDSLYVPLLAPDEGDNAYDKDNNYLSDFGNSMCEPNDVYKNNDDNNFYGDGQSKLCKYKAGVQTTTIPGQCTTTQVCDQSNNLHPNGLLQRAIQAAYQANYRSVMRSGLPRIADNGNLLHTVGNGNGNGNGNGGGNGGGGGSPFNGVPGLNTNCNANPNAPQCQSFCEFQPNAPWCNQGPSCQDVTTCEPDTVTTTPLTINANTSNGRGPNRFCSVRAVTQLSKSASALKTEIDNMTSSGNTNLISAVMWAWKTISPNSPYANFSTIEPYTKKSHEKVIVLMTDGDNTWSTSDSVNMGDYSPFGYRTNNRLGSAGGTIGVVTKNNTRSFMDAKTLEACTAAKAAGVKIFTVGFSTPNSPISSSGQALLPACATSSDRYFLATNAQQLNQAFASIGDSLAGLRISR